MTKLKGKATNCKLTCFDVNSLFTKVPIDDLLQFLSDKLHDIYLPIANNIFISLIRLCIVDNTFTFNGCFYKQIF